jgi:hypothetical protein
MFFFFISEYNTFYKVSLNFVAQFHSVFR